MIAGSLRALVRMASSKEVQIKMKVWRTWQVYSLSQVYGASVDAKAQERGLMMASKMINRAQNQSYSRAWNKWLMVVRDSYGNMTSAMKSICGVLQSRKKQACARALRTWSRACYTFMLEDREWNHQQKMLGKVVTHLMNKE